MVQKLLLANNGNRSKGQINVILYLPFKLVIAQLELVCHQYIAVDADPESSTVLIGFIQKNNKFRRHQ